MWRRWRWKEEGRSWRFWTSRRRRPSLFFVFFFFFFFFDDHMHSLSRSPFLLFLPALFACRYVSTGRAESSTLRLFMSPRFLLKSQHTWTHESEYVARFCRQGWWEKSLTEGYRCYFAFNVTYPSVMICLMPNSNMWRSKRAKIIGVQSHLRLLQHKVSFSFFCF